MGSYKVSKKNLLICATLIIQCTGVTIIQKIIYNSGYWLSQGMTKLSEKLFMYKTYRFNAI